MDARTILRKWNNMDTDDVFLKMLDKKPSSKDLKDENRLAFAMEMVVFLEQSYRVTIVGGDLKIDNFRTVDAMTQLVLRLRDASDT